MSCVSRSEMPIIKALALHCVPKWQLICLKYANKLVFGGWFCLCVQRSGEVMRKSGASVLLSPALIKSYHQESARYHLTPPGKKQPLQDEDDRISSLET